MEMKFYKTMKDRKTQKRIDGNFEVESFLVSKAYYGATYFYKKTDSLGCGFSEDRTKAESQAKEELLSILKELGI